LAQESHSVAPSIVPAPNAALEQHEIAARLASRMLCISGDASAESPAAYAEYVR
jgi:hypothetical protein